MKAKSRSALVACMVLLAGGCASSRAQAHDGQGQSEHHQHMGMTESMGMCPMNVPGTRVEATDTADGETLSFTTSEPDKVEQLRQTIQHVGAMHQRGQAMGGKGHAGQCPECPMHEQMQAGMRGMGHIDANARVENIEGGARLVLTPVNPDDMEKLRREVRQHAEQMAAGQCPMMQKGGAGAPP